MRATAEPVDEVPLVDAPNEPTPVDVPQLGAGEPETGRPAERRFRKLWLALGLGLLAIIGASMVAVAVGTLAFHLSIRPVLSASMEPTYGPGWAIITRPVPTVTLKVGDIIVFTPPGQTSQYAHRIASLTGPAAHPIITTKGDNNPTPDAWHARLASDTTPEVVAEVPFVGRLLNALGNGINRAIVIAAAGLIICVVGMVWIVRSGRRPSRPGKVSKTGDASAG